MTTLEFSNLGRERVCERFNVCIDQHTGAVSLSSPKPNLRVILKSSIDNVGQRILAVIVLQSAGRLRG